MSMCCIIAPLGRIVHPRPTTKRGSRPVQLFFHQDNLFCLLHAFISRDRCPFVLVKASAGADCSFSCSVANQSCSYCVRLSNILDSPFLSFIMRSAAVRPKCWTIQRYTLRKTRNSLNWVTLRGSFKS